MRWPWRRGAHSKGEPVLVLLWRVKRRGKYIRPGPVGEPIYLGSILVPNLHWYGIVPEPDTPHMTATLELSDEALTWLKVSAEPGPAEALE